MSLVRNVLAQRVSGKALTSLPLVVNSRVISIAEARFPRDLIYAVGEWTNAREGTIGWCGNLATHRRSLSTDGDKSKGLDRDLLYARSLSRRTFPRFLLGFNTIHTFYWLWYALDFVPAINEAAERAKTTGSNAAANFVAVDPTIGYLGLGMAIIMGSLSIMYPRHLISEIRKGEKPGSLRIKHYNLPFVTIPKGEGTYFAPCSIKVENMTDVNTILGKHEGNIALFRGHLGLNVTESQRNFLLDIKENDDVRRGDVLLNAILPDGLSVADVVGVSDRSRRRGNDQKKDKMKQRKIARNLQKLRR